MGRTSPLGRRLGAASVGAVGVVVGAAAGASPALACQTTSRFGGSSADSKNVDSCSRGDNFSLKPPSYESRWMGWWEVNNGSWSPGSDGLQQIAPGNSKVLVSSAGFNVPMHAQECSGCTAGVQTDTLYY